MRRKTIPFEGEFFSELQRLAYQVIGGLAVRSAGGTARYLVPFGK